MKRLYEEECTRAQLFGSPKPNWNEFLTINEQSTISSERICEKFDEKNAQVFIKFLK